MACKNCEKLPEGNFCQNKCDPAQTASKALLLDNAFKTAVQAGEHPTSIRADTEARNADIALLEHHMASMPEDSYFRRIAQRTIKAIRNGQRRFDDQQPDLKRRAA